VPSSKSFSLLARTATLVTMVVALLLWSAAPVLAAGGSTKPHPRPTHSPTPASGSPTPSGCTVKSSPKPASSPGPCIFPNDTGQYALGKPAIAYCNGRLYVGWTGTDDELNVGWGSTGGSFSNVVTFHYDYAYQNQSANPSIYTGPALQCAYLNNGFGQELYIAWADNNAKLWVGFFNGNSGDPYILHNYTVNNNTSYRTPALTQSSDGFLRLA
jgi:hypothetical protein